jgi:hypothetical protein
MRASSRTRFGISHPILKKPPLDAMQDKAAALA